MDENMVEKSSQNEVGSIRISDEVVKVIAGLAATEVNGVAGMSAGLVGGIAEMLGKKNMAKGVKVQVGEKEATVDLYVIVEYNVRIPDIALRVQENVKKSIEAMTGLNIVEVNIHIQGIRFASEVRVKEDDTIVK